MTRRLSTAALVVLVAFSGCKKAEPPPPPPPPPAAATPPKPAGPVSTSGKSDPACLGPIAAGEAQKLSVAGKEASATGSTLTFAQKDADDVTIFGVVSDIKEDTPANLFNLGRYLAFFKAEKAEAIVVTGDIGESASSIKNALVLLAGAGLPVFAIPGNRECRQDYTEGVEAAATATKGAVVNLARFRRVDWDDADLVSLPGYYDKRFIHCETGCQYFVEDLAALAPVVKEANDPVVLVSHGPPHGETTTAIDFAGEAGNVGDMNLAKFVADNGIAFGLFANIHEAGGKATNLKGDDIAKQDTPVPALYLNSGPADSERWAMNDGTESVGMAAVVAVQGKLARYKVFRAKALTAEERTQAEKLAAKMQAEK